jgi:hypothetical protein
MVTERTQRNVAKTNWSWLERRAKKWLPVFRKKRRVIKESRALGDSKGTPDALGDSF